MDAIRPVCSAPQNVFDAGIRGTTTVKTTTTTTEEKKKKPHPSSASSFSSCPSLLGLQ